MKVLLLNPPRAHEIIGNNPAIVEEERGFSPPLGLLYVAAYLREQTAHEVRVIDAQVEGLDQAALQARLAAWRPDVVGMTAMTMTLIDVLACAASVRAAAPAATVVLGGPHVHLYPEETIRLPEVDCLVLGEGEAAFAELVEALDRGRPLRTVPGLVWEEDGRVARSAERPPVADLDSLPFPARELTPYRRYNSLLAAGETVTTLFTSRGCPFRCRFCDRPHLGKAFRARSPENVLAEIEACRELGIREFLLYDDTFTVDRDRARRICDLIVQRQLDIAFDIRARVDTVDEDLLARLKRAGCQGIHYGVEAGTDEMLRVLNKGITLTRVREVFAATRRAGLPTLAYFMIGNPGETREQIESTFRVARELRPDYVHLTVLTPFPGTEVYRQALAEGVIEGDVWRDFARAPRPAFQPPVWAEHLDREELNDLLVRGYRSFYLRPGYILRRLARLRSWTELKRKAKAGLGVWRLRQRGGAA